MNKLSEEMRTTYRVAMAAAAHVIRNPNDPTVRAAVIAAAIACSDAEYAYYRAWLESEAAR